MVKDGAVVGHVPKNICKVVLFFLRKDGSSEVTGSRMHGGVLHYIVEIVCSGHECIMERLFKRLEIYTEHVGNYLGLPLLITLL